MNLRKLLNNSTLELKKAGSKTASLDARILLEYSINQSNSYIISHSQEPITNSNYQKFRRFIRRRLKGEPVAYITGSKEFYGYKFKVNKNVLIPRPETELIVENALHFLEFRIKNTEYSLNRNIKVIDIGTGSGCIIISLLKNYQKFIFDNSPFIIQACATDNSRKALSIAKQNAKILEVYDQIKFYHSDLLQNNKIPRDLDIIIANLPYIPRKAVNIDKTSLSFEPNSALYGGEKGYEDIIRLLEQIKELSIKPNLILIEIFEDYALELKEMSSIIFPEYKSEIIKDLAGLNRILKIFK